jgi:hypothetical protein
MRKILVAAAALLGATTGAAKAELVWDGELIVKTVTAACGTSWAPADFAAAVFRPANIDDNGVDSYFSFLQRDRALSLKIVGNSFVGNGNYAGTLTRRNGQGLSYQGTFANIVVTPANFTAATKNIQITGTIRRVENVVGCNLGFTAVFVRRP